MPRRSSGTSHPRVRKVVGPSSPELADLPILSSNESPPKYTFPVREWDRGTEIIRLFAATGWVENARPQSVMFVSEPGSGKTELIERFAINPWLSYASDLTVRGLYQILRQARTGAVTHIVASEFQKYFMRKSSTADNMLGTLCQAMEEGLQTVMVGDRPVSFDGARIGFIGAITHDTHSEKMKLFRETGFTSRCAVIDWEMSAQEIFDVMGAIGKNDKSDLAPILLPVPHRPVKVDFPEVLAEQVRKYVWDYLRNQTVLRVFARMRALCQSAALLRGADVVHARDVEHIVAYTQYWQRGVK